MVVSCTSAREKDGPSEQNPQQDNLTHRISFPRAFFSLLLQYCLILFEDIAEIRNNSLSDEPYPLRTSKLPTMQTVLLAIYLVFTSFSGKKFFPYYEKSRCSGKAYADWTKDNHHYNF